MLLYGGLLDENYSNLLNIDGSLELSDVIALDKVQKGRALSDHEFKRLKFLKLVEGRRPNLFISANVASATEVDTTSLKKRTVEKPYYKSLIIQFLQKYSEASRSDFDLLLVDKLPGLLDTEQKKNFITNLLQEMRRERVIYSTGSRRWAKWRLSTSV